jgi:hypothetical protein
VLGGKETGEVERESDTVLVLAQEPLRRRQTAGRQVDARMVRGGQEPLGRAGLVRAALQRDLLRRRPGLSAGAALAERAFSRKTSERARAARREAR